jgi:aryl-alcohol dehydrogenase-like predicted oxidoreductase
MQTRQLGNTDLELTTIGLGTWAIGGGGWMFGWGPQDEKEAVDAIIRAVELGVNWIDTAAVYGNGHSEEMVARALKQIDPARRPIVATKFGRVIQPDGTISGVLNADSVRAECEASLRRLDVETIDLYQMHWPDPEADIEEAWTTMIQLKEQGKARHIGVSNFNVAQLQRLQSLHPVASLQPPYNMIVRGVEDGLLKYCGSNGIGVVCYSPMCKGLLTGKFSKQRVTELAKDDHRTRDPKFASPQLEIHLELADGLSTFAQRRGRTAAQLSIAWILRRPEVTSAIVGARRPSQIEGTAPAGDWQLSDVEISEIDQLLEKHKAAMQALGEVSTGRV